MTPGLHGRTHYIPIAVTDGPTGDQLSVARTSVERLATYIREYFPNPSMPDESQRNEGGWGVEQVTEVLDAGLKRLGPRDTVIIYWVGHGMYPVGSHKLQLSQGSLMTRNLAKWLVDCPAQDVICILDCCWSGDGLSDIKAEVAEIRKSWSEEPEEQTLTVIASAMSDRAAEGAFVDAMLSVLTDGPGPKVKARHSWGPEAERITTAELLAGIRAYFGKFDLEQQAFYANLRYNDAGKIFPSIWHRRTHTSRRQADRLSKAHLQIEQAFMDLGVAPPRSWSNHDLQECRTRIIDAALSSVDSSALVAVLETLELAVSATILTESIVDPTKLTDSALRSAWRATQCRSYHLPIGRQFDLFYELATPRAHSYRSENIALILRFVAQLAKECKDTPIDPKLYTWAASHGLEANDVNRAIYAARVQPPTRRLVIDFCEEARPQGELPRTASAQILTDSSPVSERFSIDFKATSPQDVRLAISHLVGRYLVRSL